MLIIILRNIICLRKNCLFFRFGEVREISAQDYVAEVNKAGDGIFVVLHLYKQGIPLCALINQYLTQLAAKFPTVKVIQHSFFDRI